MGFFKKSKCPICGAEFSQKIDAMHHEQLAHSDGQYDCRKCKKSFSSMEDMRTHLQKEHSYKKDR